MSSTAENTYSVQPGRTLHHTHNIHNNPETPSSAVSSFNMPATYGSQLITPSSPYITRTTSPVVHREKTIKLSPSRQSPIFSQFPEDDGYGGSKYNEPMKFKDSTLQVASPDSGFNGPPWICADPYFGSYGVSATSGTTSGHASVSSPPSNHPQQSPNLNSSGGFSNGSRNSRQPTPQNNSNNYRTNNAPILIAPNPASLRKDSTGGYRQNSLSSGYPSQHSTPRSQGPQQMPFHHQDHINALPSSGSRKRKTPDYILDQDTLASVDLTAEESLLLQLTEKDALPWKEVASQFNEKMNKDMKVPALQMRKKRLVEKMKNWAPQEERALVMAMENYEKNKWNNIAHDMANYGSTENWTKEAVQRKWYEIHPELDEARYPIKASPEYDVPSRQYQHPGSNFQHSSYPSYDYSPSSQHHRSYSSDAMSTRTTSVYETQLDPSHPLHILQQATKKLPPRPETESSTSTGNLQHHGLMHSSPPQRHGSASSSVPSSSTMMSGVSTVTMDEVHARAEEENNTQQAIYQEQQQRVFDELREAERKKALHEVGGRMITDTVQGSAGGMERKVTP